MKLDKQTLIKHRFWAVLAVFTLVWVIALGYLLFAGGSEAEKSQNAIKTAETSLNDIRYPPNNNFTSPLEEKRKKLEEQKDKVWEQAWKTQSDLYVWPEKLKSGRHLSEQGYFGQDIDYGDLQDLYRRYKDQLPREEIVRMLHPIEGNWDTLIRRVNFRVDPVPSSEEAWLAQEDLWIYRELLNILKATQDYAAKFEDLSVLKQMEVPADEQKVKVPAAAPGGPLRPVSAEEKPKEQRELAHLRYRNPLWQLDLLLDQNDKKELSVHGLSTLTNVSVDRQPQPVEGQVFHLEQAGAGSVALVFKPETKDEKLLPPGVPLALKGTVPLPRFTATTPITIKLDGEGFQPPRRETVRRRFRNANWELDLILEPHPKEKLVISGQSKITNINVGRRILSLANAVFRIRQGESGSRELLVPSEPLAWAQTTEIKVPVAVPVFDRGKPIQVEQVFNWQTSPIKRVNSLELFHHSHKTAHLPLEKARQFPAERKTASPSPGMGPAGPGAPGPAPAIAVPTPDMGITGMPGVGGGSVNSDKTHYGLERNRYLYRPSEQVRRLPLALSVYIDQAYIQDLLTAFINSRLRMQITQWQLQHVYVRSGMVSDTSPGGPGMVNPSAPAVGMPPNLGGGVPLPPGTHGPGMVPPGTGPVEELDPNLVELAVYAVASLYERYPPRPTAQAKPAGP